MRIRQTLSTGILAAALLGGWAAGDRTGPINACTQVMTVGDTRILTACDEPIGSGT
jgi:hypothetical protein